MMRVILCLLIVLWAATTEAQSLGRRVHDAIVAAGVPITGVSIGSAANKATWFVTPTNLQSAAQPTIDAFNLLDPTHLRGEADAEVGADTLAADLLAAMLRHWPAIQAEITAGTYQEARWRERIVTTARQLRRARKGV